MEERGDMAWYRALPLRAVDCKAEEGGAKQKGKKCTRHPGPHTKTPVPVPSAQESGERGVPDGPEASRIVLPHF